MNTIHACMRTAVKHLLKTHVFIITLHYTTLNLIISHHITHLDAPTSTTGAMLCSSTFQVCTVMEFIQNFK